VSTGIYSAQFFRAGIPAGGAHVLYTVPTGYVAVIRDWSFIPFGGASPWSLLLSDSTHYFDQFTTTVAADTYRGLDRRVVLNAGEVLSATTGAGGFDGIVSGYLLSA